MDTLEKHWTWPYRVFFFKNKDVLLDVFFILVITPLLIYIGVQRSASPEWLFHGLVGFSVLISLYHLYFAYSNFRKGSSTLWINIFHLFLVAPVLFWIGYNKKEASRYPYEIVLVLGFGSLGYHTYSLMLQLNTVTGGKSDY